MNGNLIKNWIFLGMLLPTLAFAKHPKPPSPFTGLYASAGLGIGSTQISTVGNAVYASVGAANLNAPGIYSLTQQRVSAFGELTLGYGYTFLSRLYFGGLVFMDAANHKLSNLLNLNILYSISQFPYSHYLTAGIKLKPITAGLAFQPGILVAPQTLLFTTLGWESAGEEINLHQVVQTTTANSGEHQINIENRINGFRVGVGFRQQVTSALMVGINYIYTTYATNTVASTGTNTTVGALRGPFSYNLKNKSPSSQAVFADISYYFTNRTGMTPLPAVKNSDFNGFYVSGEVGALNPSLTGGYGTVTARYTDAGRGGSINNVNLTSTLPNDLAATTLSMLFGYGHVLWQHLYLGLQAAVSWSNNSTYNNIGQGMRPSTVLIAGQNPDRVLQTININEWDFQPSIDARIGGVLYERLLSYLSLGVGINRIDATNNVLLTYLDSNRVSTDFALNTNGNNGSYANVRAGAGLVFQFLPHQAFSLNYTFTDYGKVRLTNSRTQRDSFGALASLASLLQFNYHTNAFTIGYLYYF